MYMLLDVNTEIYPIDEGEKILMVLSPTLNYDGAPVTSYSGQVISTPHVLLNSLLELLGHSFHVLHVCFVTSILLDVSSKFLITP